MSDEKSIPTLIKTLRDAVRVAEVCRFQLRLLERTTVNGAGVYVFKGSRSRSRAENRNGVRVSRDVTAANDKIHLRLGGAYRRIICSAKKLYVLANDWSVENAGILLAFTRTPTADLWESVEVVLMKMELGGRGATTLADDPGEVGIRLDEETREAWVFGRSKSGVTKREAAFLRVLIGKFPMRIKGEKLETSATKSDAAHTLANLRSKDADWEAAILMAGESYGGYAVAPMSADPQKIPSKKPRRPSNPPKSFRR